MGSLSAAVYEFMMCVKVKVNQIETNGNLLQLTNFVPVSFSPLSQIDSIKFFFLLDSFFYFSGRQETTIGLFIASHHPPNIFFAIIISAS